MRGLVIVAVLIGVATIVLYVRHWRRQVAAYQAERDARWTVTTRNVGNSTYVELTKPHEPPYLIGLPVPITLPHWEHQEALAALLLEAEDKADSLNREAG
jgi:hypothetical protein